MQTDRKRENYLNSAADASGVKMLCHDGVLPCENYLEAVALCRDEGVWGARAAKSVRCVSAVCAAGAAFFICLKFWQYLYTCVGFYGLFFAFALIGAVGIFKKIPTEAAAAGTVLAGLLIFIPDLRFGLDTPAWEQTALFALLTAGFAAVVRAFFLSGIVAVAGLTAVCLYALQVWLPLGVVSWETFLSGMTAGTAVLLGTAEFFLRKKQIAGGGFLRVVLGTCALTGALIPAVQSVFFKAYPIAGNVFFAGGVLFAALIFFYARVRFNLTLLRLTVGAFCIWSELLLFLCVPVSDFSDWRALGIFSAASFFAVASVFKLTLFSEKKTEGANER